MLLPHEAHCVDSLLNAHLHTSGKLVRTAHLLCLLSRHLQDTLCHKTLPSFSHPHGPHYMVLVEANKSDRNECAISGQCGALVRQPICELCDNLLYLTNILTKTKHQLLQADLSSAPRTSTSWEAPHNLYHYVFCRFDRYQLWRSPGVGVKADIQGSARLRVFSPEHFKYRSIYLGA